jgi:hypothetical protein
LQTKREKEFITKKIMKITSEQLFKSYQQKFEYDSKHGIQRTLPMWIDSKNRSSIKTAQEVVAAMQSYINLRLACSDLFQNEQQYFHQSLADKAKATISFVGMQSYGSTNSLNLLKELLSEFSEFSKTDQDKANEVNLYLRDLAEVGQMMYEVVCQGFDRDGAEFTPLDVSELMARLAYFQENSVDVYADHGIGIYLSIKYKKNTKVNLVGDEDNNQHQNKKFTERLDFAYKLAEAAIDRTSLLERMLVELEWAINYDYQRSTTLLINAAKQELPFFRGDNNSGITGNLNHLFDRGYKKVIALVSNNYLNGGRGLINSETVFKYCVQKGLKVVIQLPMGSIGAAHEAYSILIFEPEIKTVEIDFRAMNFGKPDDPSKLFQPAERGFGKPMRKVALILKNITDNGLMAQVDRSILSLDDVFQRDSAQFRKIRKNFKLVSFEANRFIDTKLPTHILNKFEFEKLSKLVRIYRVQHMQLGTHESGIRYLEIGGNAIDQFGNLDVRYLTEKYIDSISSNRLEKASLKQGNIIFCIRGSIGKVALIKDNLNYTIAPNQSFVIMEIKLEKSIIKPELLFWWLNSKVVQDYIKSNVVSAGVPRLSIFDVYDIPIPVGPSHKIEEELKKYYKWFEGNLEFNKLKDRIEELSLRAFNDA